MRRFSADYVYTVEGEPIENGIIVTDDEGKILAITEQKGTLDPNVERFSGVIVPGFINAHCHLELSHLYNCVERETGLIPFLKTVIKYSHPDNELIIEAMRKADEEMWDNGIVAVGDISNKIISAKVKFNSKIKYHTFVEMIGFDANNAASILDDGLNKMDHFGTGSSLGLHAPYSVSKELVKQLTRYCKHEVNSITIHNQECAEEDTLYKFKDGPFMDFYKELNINTETFTAQSKNSFQCLLPFLPKSQNILFVHNTYITLKDIYYAKRFEHQIYWCFCPGANLYIENRLPNLDFFKYTDYPITLGTDSLASNDKLSILNEMKIIQEHYPNLSFKELLKWATLNGAKFLGFENEMGSLMIGKTPGLNLISDLEDGKITTKTSVKKLI
jgi:cytosine/adenosine deaminase-related metal-dependent hydrolase